MVKYMLENKAQRNSPTDIQSHTSVDSWFDQLLAMSTTAHEGQECCCQLVLPPQAWYHLPPPTVTLLGSDSFAFPWMQLHAAQAWDPTVFLGSQLHPTLTTGSNPTAVD